MAKTMSHDEWVEAAGQLAMVFWHIEKAGLQSVLEDMYSARRLLEEEQSPAGAARKLAEIAQRLREEADLSERLGLYEQRMTRHPKILVRLSQLVAQWLECRTVAARTFPQLAAATS